MGTAASIINPSVENIYRQELSKLFAEEFERLAQSGHTGAELEEQFIGALRLREGSIKEKINEALAASKQINSQEEHEEESPIDFRDLCQQTVEMIRMKYSMTFLVAVDGSETADYAFQQAMSFRKRNDHICIFHAYSSNKDAQLPIQYKKDEIRSRYESQLVALLPLQRYSFCWRERCVFTADNNVNNVWGAKEMLANLLSEYTRYSGSGLKIRNPLLPTQNPPDFAFLGYSGRKGAQLKKMLGVAGYESNQPERKSFSKPHSDPSNQLGQVPPTTLGSVADFAMRNIHIPCVICKYPVDKSRPKNFMIAVDDTELSKRGFDILLTLMRPTDSLVCLHIFKAGNQAASRLESKDVQSYYEAECSRVGPVNSSVVMLMHDSTIGGSVEGEKLKGQNIGQQLVKYVNEIASPTPDYLAIAPRARVDNDGLSSVTEYIILRVETNIILCKN